MIKPNWVMHQTNQLFPIRALVTDSSLIDSVIRACLERYPHIKNITVGDVPLQSCDFDLLCQQAGIETLREKYSRFSNPVIQFLDLRRERCRLKGGYMQLVNDLPGDPLGYSMISLNNESLLEEISVNSSRFRVSDYDPRETISAHAVGRHSYLVARSVLASDLVINMPKMKTHQKAGITAALKNLVGINGSKAYLAHHRVGTPSSGGDEFPENADPWVVAQTRLRSALQKKSALFFYPMKWGWEIVKRVRNIQTVGSPENLSGRFYVGSGSWYGNDTIWRMIYDLNKIIMLASYDGGSLSDRKQREYFCIVDGIVSGEGNGPLQPLPVESGVIIMGNNPFLIDMTVAKMMGYDFKKIPTLANYPRFQFTPWAKIDPYRFDILDSGVKKYSGLLDIPVLHRYVPPPGWRGHIELTEEVIDV